MNNENINYNDGSVKISDEVISVIAGMAASEVEGVYAMGGSVVSGITELFSGKKNVAKGIKVDMQGDEIAVDIHIVISYGVNIPDTSCKIQEKVKDALESMTGLSVLKVNVYIDGVNIERETEIEEETEEEMTE